MNLPMVDLWEYINFTLFKRAINLFAAPFHLENERMTMQIQNSRITCIIILIADKFVNKISRFFQELQNVQKGQKYHLLNEDHRRTYSFRTKALASKSSRESRSMPAQRSLQQLANSRSDYRLMLR